MSEENVELVRGVFEAVAAGDTEAVLAAYDPDVEYDFTESPLGSMVSDTVFRGHEGMRNLTRDRYEDWESIEDDHRELIDAGQHVISSVVTRVRGRASGLDTELQHYGVWTIRNHKIVKVAWFHTLADAATAAGV
jgi:ketosteroid isomerase-like protein